MRKYIIVLAGLALVLGFSSCGMKPYKSPEVETAGLFRGEDPTDTTTIADIPWRDYFTDPYLQALIEEGLQSNFDLRIAYTRIQQAEAALSQARGAFFPTVALVGQVEHTRLSNGIQGKDVLGYGGTQYTLGISATWEADIWGKLRRQKKAQYAAFLNSHAYANLVRTSLIANIATSYYSLMALDEQLRITRETVVLMDQTTETMQALLDAGLLNGASVEQSKALSYSAQVSIPDIETQIRRTENALCVLVGRKPDTIFRSVLQDQQVVVLMEHGVPMQMLARRPDVQQAELSFRSAFELTNAARAAFYPSITLGTGSSFGFMASTLSGFFKPENLMARVLGGLTQPIFARNQLKANLKSAKAQQEEALLTFEKTVLGAGQEVSDILYGYQASLSKNGVRNRQIEALNTAVYFTQELLVAGEANYTEVLTAQQNLLSAQLNRVSDILSQMQYGVNLYKALGGGVAE